MSDMVASIQYSDLVEMAPQQRFSSNDFGSIAKSSFDHRRLQLVDVGDGI
jgi:hypothetical protein